MAKVSGINIAKDTAVNFLEGTGEEYGDFVKCTNCGAHQLVPIGTEECKVCGKEGCLSWVDEENPEMDSCDVEDLGFEIISPNKI